MTKVNLERPQYKKVTWVFWLQVLIAIIVGGFAGYCLATDLWYKKLVELNSWAANIQKEARAKSLLEKK